MIDLEINTTAKYISELNDVQKKAVHSKAKSLLVLAGAGSGKTSVIVHRIANLVESCDVHPRKILAVTFTNKAAGEMRARLAKLLGGGVDATWVGTFHGIAYKLLRLHWQEIGLEKNFQVIDQEDQKRIIKKILQELNIDEDDCEPKKVQGFINRSKDEGTRYAHLPAIKDREKALMYEVYKQYEEYCQRTGVIDFAELLLAAYELWIHHPDVLAIYQNRFEHVLIDEFQDTNTIQYSWLKKLCTDKNSLTAVGDDDQSIYGWRGAKIENIQKLSKDFSDTEVIRLEQNYRSTSNILAAANSLIQNNNQRLGKKLWTESHSGEKISLYVAFNEIEEARFIGAEIKNLLLENSASEIAILYRSNAQSRVLEQVLRQHNINYKIYGGLRFFDRAEIKDALAYLRLIINKNDEAAFDRVINTPPRGIGIKTTEQIQELAEIRQVPIYQAAKEYRLTKTTKAATGIKGFLNLIDELESQVNVLSLPELVELALMKSGLTEYYVNKGGEQAATKLENLKELVTATKQYCEGKGSVSGIGLLDFLSESVLDVGEKLDEEEDAVSLMTLHSSKGLEFPVVFISGLEEGLFPHRQCIFDEKKTEEERRLCYVGITRAMKKLYLCYAQKRSFAGRSDTNRPSRFIDEIDKDYLELIKSTEYSSNSGNTYNSGYNYGGRNNSYAKTNSYSKPAKKSSNIGFGSKTISDCPYKIGDKVRHSKFGDGVVKDIEGSGNTARINVSFSYAGSKWLVIAYARLEKL